MQVRLTVAALAAVGLSVAVVSAVHTVRGFFRLDFPVTWVEAGIRVDAAPPGSSGAAAGLAAGDLVVRIDGRALTEVERPLRRLAVGRHRIEVVRRDGSRLETVLAPPPHVDPVWISRTLVALAGFACALFTLARNPKPEAPTFALLATAALVLAAVPHRTAAALPALGFLHHAAGGSVGYLLLRFFWQFPGRRPPRPLVDVAAAGLALLAGTSAVAPWGSSLWPHLAVLLRAIFVAALVAGAALQAHRWRRSVRVAAVRRQIEWASLGMVVGLTPYVALVLLPRLLGIPVAAYSWLAVLPVVAVPLGFTAALFEHRLWDLEPITRDALTATLMVVTAGLAFAVLDHALPAGGALSGSIRSLLAFVTGVALVALLIPARRQVGAILDRWLYHGRPAPRWLLTHSARDLARSTQPSEIVHSLVRALREGLEVEPISAYLHDGRGRFRVVEGAAGVPGRLPESVLDAPYPASEEAALLHTEHELRVPLERGGTVHGLLYVGRRRGIFPLGREAREVVEAFAAQAALGLESARLLAGLRRQAEEYRILHANTQRIIESSAAGILVCDTTGRILSTNARAAELLDTPSRDLGGRPLSSLVELPQAWRERLPERATGVEARTLADPPRFVLVTVSALELESGQFGGRVVVLQDVTELRHLEERLREERRLAALGRLASGLAHEINTPLTGIASYAQMLAGLTPDDDPRADLVRKIERQSFRVSRIVANLLQLARGTGGRREVVDAAAAARAAALEVAETLEASGRVRVEAPTRPVRVSAFPGALELVVGNLVRNALEASGPDGQVSVWVGARDGQTVVEVTDTGPGIPEELREKVFEPFFTTRSERGGTGLGLAISRDIIRQLGGEIELESPPEGGTVVRFRLPTWAESRASSSSMTSPSSRTS